MRISERGRVIFALERLLQADEEVRRRIRANEVHIRRQIRELEKGSTIAELMENTGASASRQSVNEGLEALTVARHEMRLAVTAAGLSEGMSIGDLGRAWGVSRQLASRFAREALSKPTKNKR